MGEKILRVGVGEEERFREIERKERELDVCFARDRGGVGVC